MSRWGSFLHRRPRLVLSLSGLGVLVAVKAFMLAGIIIIKSMGFGLALAVPIDATIVRVLLISATMRLDGRLEMMAPRPVNPMNDCLIRHT